MCYIGGYVITLAPLKFERILIDNFSLTLYYIHYRGSPKVAQRIISRINEKRKSLKLNVGISRKEDATPESPTLPPLSSKTDEELIDHVCIPFFRYFKVLITLIDVPRRTARCNGQNQVCFRGWDPYRTRITLQVGY